jgi:hypothetical protein
MLMPDEIFLTKQQLDEMLETAVKDATKPLLEQIARIDKNRQSFLSEKRALQGRILGKNADESSAHQTL